MGTNGIIFVKCHDDLGLGQDRLGEGDQINAHMGVMMEMNDVRSKPFKQVAERVMNAFYLVEVVCQKGMEKVIVASAIGGKEIDMVVRFVPHQVAVRIFMRCVFIASQEKGLVFVTVLHRQVHVIGGLLRSAIGKIGMAMHDVEDSLFPGHTDHSESHLYG